MLTTSQSISWATWSEIRNEESRKVPFFVVSFNLPKIQYSSKVINNVMISCSWLDFCFLRITRKHMHLLCRVNEIWKFFKVNNGKIRKSIRSKFLKALSRQTYHVDSISELSIEWSRVVGKIDRLIATLSTFKEQVSQLITAKSCDWDLILTVYKTSCFQIAKKHFFYKTLMNTSFKYFKFRKIVDVKKANCPI